MEHPQLLRKQPMGVAMATIVGALLHSRNWRNNRYQLEVECHQAEENCHKMEVVVRKTKRVERDCTKAMGEARQELGKELVDRLRA